MKLSLILSSCSSSSICPSLTRFALCCIKGISFLLLHLLLILLKEVSDDLELVMRLQAALPTIRHLQHIVHNYRRVDIRIWQIRLQWVRAILQNEYIPATSSQRAMLLIYK